ncbi:MAG: mandelate racemase/muconate lactonizing enzyme family protein [Pirellulales bacterium]
MKIIDILTYPVHLGGNHVFVKVVTDEHLYGIGEAYRVGPDAAVEQIIHYFKDWLVGQDPTRIEHLWRLLYNGSRFPGGSMVNAAISGIEIALWDLKGKAYGVPVYQLCGGRCRDRIRVYRSAGGGDTRKQVEDEVARVVKKQGFTAIKVSPQPAHYQQLPWGQVLRETRTRMEILRRAVGEDVDIALDPHAQIFEPIRAQELAEVVKPFRPLFYEEPLRPENIAALARLHQNIDIPLATGEMLVTKYQFRDLIAANAADILQPDLLLCGGLLEAKKIAAMAEAEYLTVAPHNPMGPISTAVSAHFAISTPNFLILEYVPDDEPPSRDLIQKPFKYSEGWLEVPDTPGLGIELNEKAFAGKPLQKWRRELMLDRDGNIAYQ